MNPIERFVRRFGNTLEDFMAERFVTLEIKQNRETPKRDFFFFFFFYRRKERSEICEVLLKVLNMVL